MGEDREIVRRVEERGLLERGNEAIQGGAFTAGGLVLMATGVGLPVGAVITVAGLRKLKHAIF